MDDVEVDVSCLRAIFQGYAGVIHENIEPADFLIDEIRRGTQAAGARDVEGDSPYVQTVRMKRLGTVNLAAGPLAEAHRRG